ncbi:MAG: YfhO family protein, partial [Oscillospiraceae bacterium]
MENCEVSDKKLALYGLLAANTITLFALAFANIRTMYMTDNTFKTFYNDVSPSVESIKEMEKDSFYRVEKDFNYSHNDGMTFGYNGLEHYSSGEKLATRRLPRIMGYTVREALGMYNAGSFLGADSFLGVKYFMSYGQGKKGTEKINECNGISTYKNPYALPLVFESSQELLELPVSKLHTADAAGEIMSVALKEEYSFTNLQGTVEQELV